MQVKHTSAWCSLSASTDTQLPGQPYQKPGQKRGAPEARLLEHLGSLNMNCPFVSADADKLGSSPFIFIFFSSVGAGMEVSGDALRVSGEGKGQWMTWPSLRSCIFPTSR